MDKVKLSLGSMLIGALFILLAIVGKIDVKGVIVGITNDSLRWLTGILGLILIVVGFLIEFLQSKPEPKISTSPNAAALASASANRIQAADFLYNPDDGHAETFAKLTSGAKQVWIMARTGVNLLNTYEATIENLIKCGCKVNLLFTDPACEATRYLYGGETEIYRQNIATTARHIASVREKVRSELFTVRVMQHAPTMSIILAEHHDPSTDLLRVAIYFIHKYGNDRPLFRVHTGDRWFKPFKEELLVLWQAAKPWDDQAALKITTNS